MVIKPVSAEVSMWYPKMERSSSHAIFNWRDCSNSGASLVKFCMFSYIEFEAKNKNPITIETSTPYATRGCPPIRSSSHCAGGLIRKNIRVATTSGCITAFR